MKGYTIDCNYIIRAIDHLPDDYRIIEMPIISIEVGLWEAW